MKRLCNSFLGIFISVATLVLALIGKAVRFRHGDATVCSYAPTNYATVFNLEMGRLGGVCVACDAWLRVRRPANRCLVYFEGFIWLALTNCLNEYGIF